MKADEQDKRREAAIHFVASHYRSGALDPERAWQRFAKAQRIPLASLGSIAGSRPNPTG